MPDVAPLPLVLFGTLRDPELLEIVLGRVAPMQPVSLPGFAAFKAEDGLYPLLMEQADGMAEGVLLDDLSAEELARLDFYEAPYGYVRMALQVAGQTCEVYRPSTAQVRPDGPWDLATWQAQIGPMTRVAALEIMGLFGKVAGADMQPRLGPIRTRAQAQVNAAAQTPMTRLRQGPGRDAVTLERRTQPYSKFFTVEEMTLRHRRFDGGENVVERAVFSMADAVIVLPYDPARDVVLLIEQFRPGPYLRGDRAPWSLEAIAGRIDGGEQPEDAVRREAMEEAGVTLKRLNALSHYYPSPGGTNEYLYCFLGITDLPDGLAGLGGLDSEAEDIRSMVVSFDDLMQAVQSGEVQNGPLLICALQLEQHRAALRADAGKGPTPA